MRENRAIDEMRTIEIKTGFTEYAEGSVLISFGNTRVLCNASVEEKVPSFVKEKGDDSGWITGEYNMLPRATHSRTPRERFRVGGRTQEIQRLIGRSLRSIVNLQDLGPRTITLDCDVIQADGGTRTAAISGAFIAMVGAMKKLKEKGILNQIPVAGQVAAVSVGKCRGEYLLDLNYEEDHRAEIDMNVVMTEKGEFIEIQGTGESCPFTNEELNKLVAFAKKGIEKIISRQKEAI